MSSPRSAEARRRTGCWSERPDGKAVLTTGSLAYAASLSRAGDRCCGCRLWSSAGLLDVDAPIRPAHPLPRTAGLGRDQGDGRASLLHPIWQPDYPRPNALAGPGHWTSDPLHAASARKPKPSLPPRVAPSAIPMRPTSASAPLSKKSRRQRALRPLRAANPLRSARSGRYRFYRRHPISPSLPFMGDILPLVAGAIGGIWSHRPEAFAPWLDPPEPRHLWAYVNLGALQPGRLNDGTPTDYGWGIGLRLYRSGCSTPMAAAGPVRFRRRSGARTTASR